MLIESVENNNIKFLRKLSKKKYRDEYKKYIIEGIHLVKEAYQTNNLEEVYIVNGKDYDLDIKKTYITENIMKSISSLETPYDIIGICNYNQKEDLKNRILILDNIQDPGNLGTIIRSSVAFNIDTIVLSKNSVDLYNSKVLRGAQGMNFYINIIRKDLKEFIINLKKNNYKIYGTNVVDGKNIKNVKNTEKYAIIMGNEGAGVSNEILFMCDENIYIKMSEKCESLNVAVATSIILYELSK